MLKSTVLIHRSQQLALGAVFLLGCLWLVTRTEKLNLNIGKLKMCFKTDPKFQSFALDSSFLHNVLPNMTSDDWNKLSELLKPLSPAYLRLGGTDCDRTIFKKISSEKSYILTEKNWIRINEFAVKSKVNLIFDLNVLLRDGEKWDPRNARLILNSVKRNGFKVHFQLGNEPNSFHHVFNRSVSPEQLGKDFKSLKKILEADNYFSDSFLIGPDVTRPKNEATPAMEYLRIFLKNGIDAINAVSWHQYYVNGRNATADDFLNPLIMNVLREQTMSVKKTVGQFSKNIPIWLGETGSAFGGGAPELSDRFASIFFYVDKLGLSAQLGLSVIVRQSLYQGHYSLINNSFHPNPDYWISLLYKQIVGQTVFWNFDFNQQNIRLYAHGVQKSMKCIKNPNLTPTFVLFGMNLANTSVDVQLTGFENINSCASYVFQGTDLNSRNIFLNGRELNWDFVKSEPKLFAINYASLSNPGTFPARSVVFWVISAHNRINEDGWNKFSSFIN